MVYRDKKSNTKIINEILMYIKALGFKFSN